MTNPGIVFLMCLFLCFALAAGGSAGERWSAEKANAWYAKQPWLAGCNFINSNAINQIEMLKGTIKATRK